VEQTNRLGYGEEELRMRLAITGDLAEVSAVERYEGWLLRFNPMIHFVELTRKEGQPSEVETCDGLLLTGGGDIHPRHYGVPDDGIRFREIDERRDEIEFAAVEKAMSRSIPILGICRGLQTVNVFLGGSLHPDLVMKGFRPHAGTAGRDHRHDISIEQASMLGVIAGRARGSVNSTHHQGIDRLGRGLAASAKSEDGVVEALEQAEKKGRSFLLLVQWHPERMKDSTNPLAEGVARTFLEETRKHGNQKQQLLNHQHQSKNYYS